MTSSGSGVCLVSSHWVLMDLDLGIRRTERGTEPLTFYCRYLECVTLYLSTLCMPPLRDAYTSLRVRVDLSLCLMTALWSCMWGWGWRWRISHTRRKYQPHDTLLAVKRPKCSYELEMRLHGPLCKSGGCADENSRCPCQE
jgi:hypothetical protein